MKPHHKATLSFGQWVVVAGAAIAAMGMSGALGDPDVAMNRHKSDLGKTAEVAPAKKKPKPKVKVHKAEVRQDEPPPMACVGDWCGWIKNGSP